MTYLDELVCPLCTADLKVRTQSIECLSCKKIYHIKKSIPLFIEAEELTFYNTSTFSTKLTAKPLPFHTFYTKFVNRWGKMLDLGCGDGVMSAEAASIGKAKDIFCLDPSLTALQILRKRNILNMYPICTVGEKLPFRDSYFDGVFNIFVIEHLKNSIPLLKEVHRVLKQKGEFIIATDNKWYDKYIRTIVESVSTRKLKIHHRNPTHVNLMVPRHLRKLLRATKFQILDEHMSFFYKHARFFPKIIRESFFTSMFVFVCIPLK